MHSMKRRTYASRAGVSHEELADLLRWSKSFFILADQVPSRLSLPQAALFTIAALCDRMGAPENMTSLRDVLGPRAGRSVQTSYAIFLPPCKKHPHRLGWLDQAPCPTDGRVKLLRLTRRGAGVIDRMIAAVREGRAAAGDA
jgi:hypothetical protein